ncbi:MAG: 2,4-dienoyl-CoA reductase [Burkholderiales bacterium RIFCSPLOWO2_12_67_14]|uniref:SDR family oxidoreductase n=1 Tax=unclassified Hydrogenophaga TaxID=2610897 RepID=UPI0006F61180|nr:MULTISPECIES: SDR family oxidoreductase [unclassified Hydrogenophaga]MDZ4144361.1 SDR family oxidoreductase [Burkholderiales bacterium]OGB39071.1 MAG: 2,4-dienoyl-CoA reductase [Burkholderiales bacterium RIFCSPLOWO2_12_67_14]OGB83217.1 MAG: 2,4-dienoyl-CoA reductase [Burkholderiales bacterium RIFCSPLOWO2_12_FULL_67_210]RYE48494.1 MAG: SDR family oxidoreductase [Hyphomicrobiales bacterium]AOF85253.1 short chain dehydrogenase family protein [Hydrogenophaga sp. RAC07]
MSQSTYRSVFRPGLFVGQTVIVTGGGSGIGRCTAHELANLGASVALVGRRVEKLEAVQAEITQAGGRASIHACDIRDEAGVKAMIADVIAQHGKIDGLVNNAGGQYPQPVKDISLKGWDAVVRSNLTGGFLVAREAFNQSMEFHGGAIVNIIADIWGGMPTMAHSGAARAGMLSFTETAACEWACAGVRVNAVAPGWIASSGFDTYSPEMQAELRSLKTKVPLQRYGTEAEISAAIVFLLCEAAAFITGSCIRVDGGVPNARPTWKLQAHDRSKPFNGFALAEPPKCLSVKDQ